MNRTIYKPLLPDLRQSILKSIAEQIGELSAVGVSQNALVKAEKAQLAILYRLFQNLPDGYPIPIEKR